MTSDKRRLLITVAVAVVALDAASKALAAHFLAGRGTVSVDGIFYLRLYHNHAGPGGVFEGHPVLVSLLAAASVTAIIFAARHVRTTTTASALGLLLGGGVGNLLDRLASPEPLRGGVIDWLKPTLSSGSMNLADLAINAAVLVLLLGTAFEWWAAHSRHSEPDPPVPQPSP